MIRSALSETINELRACKYVRTLKKRLIRDEIIAWIIEFFYAA
jgi:hypothetical protein